VNSLTPVYRLPLVLVTTLLVLAPPGARAQTGDQDIRRATAPLAHPPEWNSGRVLGLLQRAAELRRSVAIDPEFRTYRAQARGYVYFFVDRPDSTQNLLVKTDQVALDVLWRAPNSTRQTIVGLRDEQTLPTKIRYHMDHLTVVQDDYGDYIRLGDGDEVSEVVHPAAPLASEEYDFQLLDSLTLFHSDGQREVRVYEIRVRPRDFERPGFVGTIYLDRARAAVVRMNFSFTPASYVDKSLDYIRISLDNSLWMGSHWLPYRQEIEIRREMPYFDFVAGSVIRGRFEISGYEFNEVLSPSLFAGRAVRSVSPAQQEAFAFERGLFDDLEEGDGLSPSPSMEAVRAQVGEVVAGEVLSGLAPIRFHASRLSDFARYNRAEGVFTGGGFTWRPVADVEMRATAGYAFGRSRGSGRVALTGRGEGFVPKLDAYWDVTGDIGGHPGATPLENSITSAAGSRDYLDPYFRRGASVTVLERTRGTVSFTARFEEHVGARNVVSTGAETDFRAVRSIAEGTLGSLSTTARLRVPARGRADIVATAGRLADQNFVSLSVGTRWEYEDDHRRWSAATAIAGGWVSPDAPPQMLFLLGGRHTLPGHEYRLFVGNAYWLVKTEGMIPIRPPWLGMRATASLGAAYLNGDATPADWAARDSRGVRGSVGLGLAIGWDTMRFDVSRAVWGTGWEAVFSVAPRFRSWM
jgi:hypothetical protein